MASAAGSRKKPSKDERSELQWNATQLKHVCATMKGMLRALNEYDTFPTLSSDAKNPDATQVAITLQYLIQFNLLPFDKTDKLEFVKTSKQSIEFRNSGNTYFMKDNKMALMFYCKSIAAAPYPTSKDEDAEELALAFANRSAVYFVMKKYEACLKDIEQALTFNYPDKMKYKLLERRAKCYQNMGRKDEATASAKDALEHLSTATYLPEDKMKSTIDALNKLQVGPCAAQSQPSESGNRLKPLPQKAFGQHKKIPCASECVDIKYKRDGGRHVVANRDIDPGDVLFVEEPYASLIEEDVYFTHCNNCTQRSDAMIPCLKCDQVMYCSKSCREASWESCHRIECQILPALRRLDIGDSSCLIALRILLVACSQNNGILGLLNLENELNQQSGSKVKGFDKHGRYLSSDYYQVHHLFRNIRKEPDLQINWSVTAACILNCLEARSDLFTVELSQTELGNVVISTGGLIFKYVQIISTNAYAVTELVRKAHSKNSEDLKIAVGLYSTLSLLNHSCDPTACKSFHNGTVNVVIARQPIRKGEEVTMSYGDYFDHSDVATRRAEMRYKYCFECQCVACTNNWPSYDNLESLVNPTFICKTCRVALPKKPVVSNNQWVACHICKKKYNVERLYLDVMVIKDRVSDIYDVTNSINCPDFTSELAGMVKSLDMILKNPNQLSNSCQEYLRISMKTSGNNVVE